MKLLNVRYDNLTVNDALAAVFNLLEVKDKADIFFLNTNCLYIAQHDESYCAILNKADLLLPDGVGLRVATRLFGGEMKEDCNGTDISPKIIEQASQRGLKIFFLGGRDGVARKAAQNIQRKNPAVKIVGTEAGYFENDLDVIARINAAAPDILFVARGVPLQEKWIAQNRHLLNVRLCLGVGALLDYLAEVIPRAPKRMRKMHLEWLWRILIDPRRMFKRYVIDGSRFCFYLICQRIRSRI